MWIYVIVVVILIFAIYAFLTVTGVQMRWLSRRSNKTAESIYDNYGESDREEQQYARQHGGTWTDAEGSEPRRPAPSPAGVHGKKTGRI